MSHSERARRLGGLAVAAVAAAPFVSLWVAWMRDADDPLTFRARRDMAIWIGVFGTPWMIAAQLLRRPGAGLSTLDGPARVLWALPLGVLAAAAGRRPTPTASGSTGAGRR